MANERVSQLIDLFATDLQSNDLLLVTDMSQRESKKLEIGQLLLFIEGSGSFSAYHATTADTASYVNGNNVHGTVTAALTSSLSTTSISSSYANTATSSSYALLSNSASYSNFCVTSTSNADTASYLIYSGFPNGTASYALRSLLSDTSTSSSNLIYNGTSNGTASYAITSSNANAASYSISASYSVSSSMTLTSSYAYQANNSNTANSSNYSVLSETASFVSQNLGPKFITPINLVNSTTLPVSPAGKFITCSVVSIPLFTKVVILQYWITSGFNSTAYQSYVTSSSGAYRLGAIRNDDSGTDCSGQGMYPVTIDLNGSASFFLTSVGSSRTTTIDIIGYY